VKKMRWKAAVTAIGLALAAVMAACGGSGEDTTTTPPPPPVSAATADNLAKLSDRIATNLDAGLTCDAAYAADELKAAVEEADLSARLRPGVEEVATNLVNEVNCPPPPPPPPEPEEEEKKKDEEKKKGEQQQDGEQQKQKDGEQQSGDQKKQPEHGGVPPAQAILEGEGG
jgi:hypothetical protein